SRLDPVLASWGSRGYRTANLVAGLYGGRMYLAAYALGLGATGLTFYDDDVVSFFSPEAAGADAIFVTAVGRPPRGEGPRARPWARAGLGGPPRPPRLSGDLPRAPPRRNPGRDPGGVARPDGRQGRPVRVQLPLALPAPPGDATHRVAPRHHPGERRVRGQLGLVAARARARRDAGRLRHRLGAVELAAPRRLLR